MPEYGSIDDLCRRWIGRIGRELLHIICIIDDRIHEVVIDFDGNIGSCNFAFRHLGIDKRFRIRMFDGDRKHQRTSAAILSHFAC